MGPISSAVFGWNKTDYSLTVFVLLGCPFPGPVARKNKLLLELFCMCLLVFFQEAKRKLRELTIMSSLGCQGP